ncbi:MAG: YqaJ viral recombinase family protein, partial [Bacteroidales bacterium]
WYSDTTGRVVRVPDKIIKSNKYPFMLASLDGFTDDKRVVEIKTARHGKDWGEPGTNEIPDYYAVQCHHYMIVTGYEVTDMPVSIAGGSPALYEVPADKEIAEMIIEACASFWQRVQAGDPPDPVTYADAVQRYGGIRAEGIVTADEELLSIIEKLKETRATIKDLEVTEEYLKGKVIMALGERGDTLVAADGKPLATYRLTKGRAVLDTKTLQTEMPDVWAKYQKTLAPQRRFLVK